MRVWDQVPPGDLCGKHLLAQWREGLGLWNILTQGKSGYANHPETRRWRGNERALLDTLHRTRAAMLLRGWNPKPAPEAPAIVQSTAGALPAPWDDQVAVLRAKGCKCNTGSVLQASPGART